MRFLFLICLLAAGAAYLTKPTEADAEQTLKEQLKRVLSEREIGQGRSTGENLALAACKLRPNDCYDLLRSGLDVTFTDQTLFVRVEMDGFDRTATCFGAFKQFVCPGGLKRN